MSPKENTPLRFGLRSGPKFRRGGESKGDVEDERWMVGSVGTPGSIQFPEY